MSRVLLVGGGITSAMTASIIMETIPNICVTVWDKARGAGGRMSTSRSPSDPTSSVDLGQSCNEHSLKLFGEGR